MRTRRLGASDTQISMLGQGTWRVRDHARTSEAIREGLKLGMTHIDTAELYENQSRSETMLGQVLKGSRDNVFLASKVLPHNASYDGTLAACEASLKRLGTDHLDLYYLHWRGEHPLEDTFDAMAELVESGKVRHIGVSNFDVADLDEAESLLGKGVLAANQVLYHLEERGAESDVLPWCKQHKVTLVAYSPFGAGTFLASAKARTAVEDAARTAGLTPRQVALAFLTRDPAVVAIPKTESVAHVRDNAGGDIELGKAVINQLDTAFPVQRGLRAI
ncbi:MAG: aldo/keto reductase [Candidatus Thermoplasmatota archaeon]|jgi:diketogulonate reductase-like aldo/keto reductase